MAQPTITRLIEASAHEKYQGNHNRATWIADLYVGNTEVEYKAVFDLVNTNGVDRTADYLIARFGLNGRKYPQHVEWLDRTIFTRGTMEDLNGRDMSPLRIAETLQRVAQNGNMFEGYSLYGDLLAWAIDMLDYRGLVEGTVQQVYPTYRAILNVALFTIDWRDVARSYREE